MSRDAIDPVLQVADHVVFRELDGEAVLLNLQSGIYFGLDTIGTHVWQAIDRQAPLQAIVAALVAAYDVDRETAERDVRRLVAQLVDRGLLTSDTHARPPV